MTDDCITREDLIERVTLPMGNIAHVLAVLVDEQTDMHPVALKTRLRRVLATVEDIHEFLQGLSQTMEERREPRTPEQLRAFVAEKVGEPDFQAVKIPVRRLDDILIDHLTLKGG